MADGSSPVYVVFASGDHVWVERRRLLRGGGEVAVVSAPGRPGGEQVRGCAVFADWPAAVEFYWQAQRGVRSRLRRQLRALEQRIAGGREPGFLRREG